MFRYDITKNIHLRVAEVSPASAEEFEMLDTTKGKTSCSFEQVPLRLHTGSSRPPTAPQSCHRVSPTYTDVQLRFYRCISMVHRLRRCAIRCDCTDVLSQYRQWRISVRASLR